MKCIRLTIRKHKGKSQEARGFLPSLLKYESHLPPISASPTHTDEIPWPLKPAADLSAISAEARFSPAPHIHSNTSSATPASTRGCSTAALGAGSSREQAERKAASLKKVRVTALREASRIPSSVAPVTTHCSAILGGRRKQEQQHSSP